MSATNPDWIDRSRSLKICVRNFVNGRWQSGNGEEKLQKYGPRDGILLYRFGAGSAKDADEAVASARRAFDDGRWSKLASQRRKEALQNLAALMQRHSDELALLECLDTGKPINETLNFDVPASIAIIQNNAESAGHVHGKVYGSDPTGLSYELIRPIGVVAGIVGWNFPLVLAASKIGPALATGNSLVLKPSEFTSLSAARIAELAVEAGVPEGVFNVIHGSGAVGSALSMHRDVDLVTFTGSTQTGKKLLIASGQSNMKRLLLECGGKAPSIVFDDCPSVDTVADRIVERAFWNQGQVCTASSRLLIQESIRDEVLRRVVNRTSTLVFDDPLKPETRFAAVVSREHQQKVLGFVERGEKDGARMIYQSTSKPPFDDGFYAPPTIFDNVLPGQKIAQEEIFGPVLSVISFRDDEEAIEIANGTMYGLSAILWTKDLGRAHRMTQAIRAGWVVVNATGEPMSGGAGESTLSVGGHKQSGLGVEGGVDGLKTYTSQTAVQFFV